MTFLPRGRIETALERFVGWLEGYGETSFDHQSFYAGPIGRRAKETYYRRSLVGKLAVAPMVAFEAFVPSARRLFWHKMRLPIADAHYAMGFALLYQKTGDEAHYRKAIDFLSTLIETRCPGYADFCWGYPFDWVTQQGTIPKGTPLITTTPYVYEAFEIVHAIDQDPRWLGIMRSIAEHAANDIPEFPLGGDAASAGYHPRDPRGGVINAGAYRAFLLARASRQFGEESYWRRAERNLNFVLQAQKPDGSWTYAVDASKGFIDHFHTCFVMKALAKVENVAGHSGCRKALEAGIRFYVKELFDQEGLPKPFSKAPRLTVYRNELYDYAECLNLGWLLGGRSEDLDRKTARVLSDLLERWQTKAGSFRSRKLLWGWDVTPMHRWGQSQIFRSLGLFLDPRTRLRQQR